MSQSTALHDDGSGVDPSANTGRCAHCEAPTATEARFCCAGCEAVHGALHAGGLAAWYRLRDRDPEALRGVPARPGGHGRHGYLDSERYRKEHCRPTRWRGRNSQGGDGQVSDGQVNEGIETEWMVRGMTCVACAWLIEQLGQRQDGLVEIQVDPLARSLRLRASDEVRLAAFADELAAFGYGIGLPGEREDGEEARRDLAEVAIAGALAANTMLLTLPLYFGLDDGPLAALFAWVSAALATVCLFSPARPFVRVAWAGLKRGVVGLDLPIALGIVAAWLWSMAQLPMGRWHALYFDSLTVLVFALRLGRFVQARAIERAAARARLLAAAMPQLVRTWRQGRWQELPPEDVAVGERIRLDGGEELPFEAELSSDDQDFDLRVVTGESRPQRQIRGARVVAGAIPLTGATLVRVSASDAATANRPTTPRRRVKAAMPAAADRLGVAFTSVVLTVAALSFAGWWWHASAAAAIEVAVAVLIVACPCALGLATPVTVAMAVASAARRGVLVQRAAVLEALAEVRSVVFDKTGTVTEGRPAVVDSLVVEPDDWPEIRRALVQIEATSRHPVASALVAHLGDTTTAASEPPQRIQSLPGSGIAGLAHDWRVLALSARGAAERDLPTSPTTEERLKSWRAAGHTIVLVYGAAASPVHRPDLDAGDEPRLDDAGGLRLVAGFATADRLRTDAVATVAELRRDRGLETWLISGDHQRAVDRVADRLQVDGQLAEASPQAKVQQLGRLAQRGAAVMVGDGHNDIAALERADVAVAVGSATPAAVAASDVVLPAVGLHGLVVLFDVATGARRVAHVAIAGALVYNALTIGLAAAGAITPLLAAILMPISSLSVVGWAWVKGSRLDTNRTQTSTVRAGGPGAR